MDIAGWLETVFSGRKKNAEMRNFEELLSAAHSEPREVLKRLGSRESGLAKSEARAKLRKYGLNKATGNGKHSRIRTVVEIFLNPLVALMSLMAIVSFLTAQFTTAVIIVLMVGISTILNYVQETKADRAAEKLKAMVQTTATVLRDGVEREIALRQLVPGDIVRLSAGDIVPADVRIVSSKDLFVNQSTLTGESVPVEKHAPREEGTHLFELQSVCFMGTSVESGTATAVVLLTGKNTYFGSIAESLEKNVETGFEKGIAGFTDLMVRFILLMAPAVFFINWFKGNGWFEAFLFALAVVVGLTPELLPMIITVNLAKGAVTMSAKKVIVKRLNSIQNLGAMNVLCTDKTGTLTQGKIILVKHIDLEGKENEQVLRYAYLNSYFQTGLKNVTDQAVLKHENLKQEMSIERNYKKIDEVGFDFQRRRMSVIVDDGMKHLFVCKGAIEETFSVCERAEIGGKKVLLKGTHLKKMKELARALNED
ncbi:MAG: HAD-IC family P-type ATPase, partial [Candidatus Micrarchaeia archaeon]